MDRWSAKEIADDEDLIRKVEDYNIRKCTYCGLYAPVENFAGEYELDGNEVVYDICDACSSALESGKDTDEFDSDYYEDFLD